MQNMMRQEFEEHYGLDLGVLTNYLECAVDTNDTGSTAGSIHPAPRSQGGANSSGFPINISSGEARPAAPSLISNNVIEDSLRPQIKHLQEQINNHKKEAATKGYEPTQGNENRSFLSGPYSETLEGCEGTREFPEDWVEGVQEYRAFKNNEEEDFIMLTNRPQEDPGVEKKGTDII